MRSNLAQYGFSTTCMVAQPTAVAAIEVTAKTDEIVSIELLSSLADKMVNRPQVRRCQH